LVVLLELAGGTARPYPRTDEDSGHHYPIFKSVNPSAIHAVARTFV
jgi:hypothetical protein